MTPVRGAGISTEAAIAAITRRAMAHAAPRVRLVEVGQVAGRAISLPADVLRSSGLEILGSGPGTIPLAEIISAIPSSWPSQPPATCRSTSARCPLPRSSRPGSAAAAAGGPSSGPDHEPACGVQKRPHMDGAHLDQNSAGDHPDWAGLYAFFLRFSIAQRDGACRCRSSTRCSMTSLKVAVGRGVLRSCGRTPGRHWAGSRMTWRASYAAPMRAIGRQDGSQGLLRSGQRLDRCDSHQILDGMGELPVERDQSIGLELGQSDVLGVKRVRPPELVGDLPCDVLKEAVFEQADPHPAHVVEASPVPTPTGSPPAAHLRPGLQPRPRPGAVSPHRTTSRSPPQPRSALPGGRSPDISTAPSPPPASGARPEPLARAWPTSPPCRQTRVNRQSVRASER